MAASVEILSGPLAGNKFEFADPGTLVFGRGEKADCLLPDDPGISRRHFLIEFAATSARLRDLGSANGVEVNGTRYGGRDQGRAQSVELRDGDRIRVGKFVLLFRTGAVPLPCPPGPGKLGLMSLIGLAGGLESRPPAIPGYDGLERIGRGAAGVVYRARRIEDGRRVAIKTLNRPPAGDLDAGRERFSREIEITRGLRHENVVEFLDAGYLEKSLYLILEFMAGGDLAIRLKKHPAGLPVGQSLAIMRQILSGMALAHRNGVVHRDIKPGNILFADPEATVAKVADLGMAKTLSHASSLTMTGSGGGTPSYMAPEQITNFRHSTPASDVFSLAATFYKMLTNEAAYNFLPGREYLDTIIDGDIVPIQTRAPFVSGSLPRPLAELIMRGVSPNPEDRFPDAGAMLNALDACRI
ncbi:MAG: protein kinase [Planctomycetota bacterium]|jgi:serine/threonine protein kinase|nr:protein kinase [Planctomycetota bacterium]